MAKNRTCALDLEQLEFLLKYFPKNVDEEDKEMAEDLFEGFNIGRMYLSSQETGE